MISEECQFPEVDETGAGRVVALTANELASGLLSVLDRPEEAAEMGRRGRALAEKFTWHEIAARTASLYEDLVS